MTFEPERSEDAPTENHNAREPQAPPQSGEKTKWRTPTVAVLTFAHAKHEPHVATDGAADMAGSVPFPP